ncbi:MAG: sodium:solute symporter, partial [Actinomycetota bacterium]|nr:sodium:solute symporter [Actinomycetota bacterium]
RACFIGAAGTAAIGTVFALVALTASSVLGITVEDGPILFTLLADYAPPLLAILVLSGIVAASFSTASGAILATSAIAVRNIFNVRRTVEASASRGIVNVRKALQPNGDPLLRWTRLAMIPIVVAGAFLAIRVSQTGILLTLAFDLMLACLAAPFILGVFWKRPGITAALLAAAAGLVVRMTLLALTPTLYGVPNDLLYIENTLIGADFDGWATLVAALVGFGTFVLVGVVRRRSQAEELTEMLERESLEREQAAQPDDESQTLVS